eukprot:XP_001704460.1 Hypothetical protein GL50803_36477 [Giardia lamblia ATCC 50803]
MNGAIKQAEKVHVDCTDQGEEEPLIVGLVDAASEPEAVMVEPVDTGVAVSTVDLFSTPSWAGSHRKTAQVTSCSRKRCSVVAGVTVECILPGLVPCKY